MAGPKPFIVCGISTKWQGPKTYKTPVRKLSWAPLGTSTEERSSGPRRNPTKQTSRPGCSPAVAPKVDRRRPPPKPTPQRLSDKTIKDQKSLPVSLVPSSDRSSSKKTVAPKPSKIMTRLKEGKVTGESPASLRVTSTRVTTAEQLPPRPSCISRTATHRSPVGVMAAGRGKRCVPLEVLASGPRHLGVAQKPSMNAETTKTAGWRVKVIETLVKKPTMVGGCRTGARTPKVPVVACPAFPITWSPPPSPDLSSFPSQSWTIVVDMGVEPTKTSMNSCGNETLSSVGDVVNSSVAGTPTDSYGRSSSEFETESGSVSSSPALSLSLTVIDTPARLTEPIGSDSVAKISSQTKEPSTSTWVSDAICAATIISPGDDSTTTSMATLAKVMEKSQPPLPAKGSDSGDATRMTVRSVVETIWAFFSPLQRASQCDTGVTPSTAMGFGAALDREPFVSPLDKDTKLSKNPMTHIEIAIPGLGARRKVADGGAADPRMDPLGSLAKMAIATKVRTCSSNHV